MILSVAIRLDEFGPAEWECTYTMGGSSVIVHISVSLTKMASMPDQGRRRVSGVHIIDQWVKLQVPRFKMGL